MKRAIRWVGGAVAWVVKREPVIAAGVTAAVGLYFVLRYNTNANGAVQAASSSTLVTLAGFISRFTTPAGSKAVAAGQANLPGVTSDLDQLFDFLGAAIHEPKNLLQLLEEHAGSLRVEINDLRKRLGAVVSGDPSSTQAPPVTAKNDPTFVMPDITAESVPAHDAEATGSVDHLANLRQMQSTP